MHMEPAGSWSRHNDHGKPPYYQGANGRKETYHPEQEEMGVKGPENAGGETGAAINRDDARNTKLTAIHPAALTTPMAGRCPAWKGETPLASGWT